jgi:cytoskeletal protein RodZ
MDIESSERRVGSEGGDRAGPEYRGATSPPRRASRMRVVLSSLVALLLLAALIYYFADRRSGTEIAMRPSAEGPPLATAPRPGEIAESPARSKMPSSPSQPASPQQSATPVPSPGAPLRAEPQGAPSATTAQDPTSVSPPETTKRPADSVEAAPKTESPVSPPAPVAPQPSMRDQPAALPDQPAAAPKNETILVVTRGPANIRSAPGKGGRVIGTAAKNAIVKEVGRSGKWVEVQTENGTGWIATTLLGVRGLEPQ